MAKNIFEKTFEEEQQEANKINSRADELKKEEPELSWSKAADRAIKEIENRKKMGSQEEYSDFIEESEIRSRIKALFYARDWRKKGKYTSDDLLHAMENIWTTTGIYNASHSFSKVMTALEMGDYVEDSGLGGKAIYYLAANRDYQFPLAFRFRNIKMIDPCYEKEFKEELYKELAEFDGFAVKKDTDEVTELTFNFDFGRGKKEAVNITLMTQNMYELEKPQEDVGAVLSFFSGPGSAPALTNQNLYGKITEGGFIFDDDRGPIYSLASDKVEEEQGDNFYELDFKESEKLIKEKEKEIASGFGFEARAIPGTSYRAFVKKRFSQEWLDFLNQKKKNNSRPLNIPSAKDYD